MSRKFSPRKTPKPGLSPGTLLHLGEKKSEHVHIQLFQYTEEELVERELARIEEGFPYLEKPGVTWINVDGLHDVSLIESVGQHFDYHPLMLEDILATDQRPKMEDYETHLFVIIRMLRLEPERREIQSEQTSLILGKNYVLSFQEAHGDAWEPVRQRLRSGKGRIRKMGPDYLAYALIDAVVDHYFVVLEQLGEQIEELELELVTEPSEETLRSIHRLKREMLFLRKAVWPLREVVGALLREEDLIQERTSYFLRDVYDHTIQVIDTIETYRDMVSGMLDTYLSSLSNRMNEVMKVLTIIATIFIPLTFVAGIYGMNFDYMPELHWRWGYFAVWGLMILLALLMLAFFRRRKWL